MLADTVKEANASFKQILWSKYYGPRANSMGPSESAKIVYSMILITVPAPKSLLSSKQNDYQIIQKAPYFYVYLIA